MKFVKVKIEKKIEYSKKINLITLKKKSEHQTRINLFVLKDRFLLFLVKLVQ